MAASVAPRWHPDPPNHHASQHITHASVILIALVERHDHVCLNHSASPNYPLHHPIVATAEHALISTPHLVFPPDIPVSDSPPHLGHPLPCPPTPRHHPTTSTPRRSRLGSNPPRDHAHLLQPADATAPPPSTVPELVPNVDHVLEQSEEHPSPPTVPSQHNLYKNPVGETSHSALNLSGMLASWRPRTSRTFSNLSSSKELSLRRINFNRRPSSTPTPPRRSDALPSFMAAAGSDSSSSSTDDISSDEQSSGEDDAYAACVDTRRRHFRFVLLSAAVHVFAITARDGSRQYAYCRPLSSSHALVVLSAVPHSAVYVSALERSAAHYANIVDDTLADDSPDHRSLQNSRRAGFMSSSFLAADAMRCPPFVAKLLVASLLGWLSATSPCSSRDLLTDASKTPAVSRDDNLLELVGDNRHKSRHRRGNSSNHIDNVHNDAERNKRDVFDHPPAGASRNHSSGDLTSSTTSSGLSANGASTSHENVASADFPYVNQRHDPGALWDKEKASPADKTNSTSRGISALPWDVAAESMDAKLPAAERVIELADANLLLRNFPVRTLVSLIVALLQEHSVCLVGPNTAVVSRAVLALDNLLRPFKWPHLISPILLEHMLPVLGAPFPFLVGILESHFSQTKDIPLDYVVFGDLSTGKVTASDGSGELYRHMPRRIRNRLERRLTKAKIACTRQVFLSRSMLFTPTVSNTATSFLGDDPFDDNKEKERPNLLRRSRSSFKLGESVPQNIWLQHETVGMLDKAVRKLFAELLDGFLDHGDDGIHGDAEAKDDGDTYNQKKRNAAISLSSSKRDSDRRQLAMAFQQTQMFMQWEDDVSHDPSFGISASAAESQRGNKARKRSKLRDNTLPAMKVGAGLVEEKTGKSSKFKVQVLSDTEDVLSADDVSPNVEEVSTVRKRFRSKRKQGQRLGARLQFSQETKNDEIAPGNALSDGEEVVRDRGFRQSATELSIPIERIMTHEGEIEEEPEVAPRRAWLSLRLPSSPWTLTRDRVSSTLKEDDDAEILAQSDVGDETDGFGDVDDNLEVEELYPSEDVGAAWPRMRNWNRRKHRHSTRM